MTRRMLAVAIGCVGIGSAWGHTGLTSVSVDQSQANGQQEPTLAQVAPIQHGAAAPGTATSGAAPGAVPSAAARAAAAGGNRPSAVEAAEGNASAAARAPAPARPPPPPDPAKLPISVIRPLNKPAQPPPATPKSAPMQSQVHEVESHPTKPPPRPKPVAPAPVAAPRPAPKAPVTTPAHTEKAAPKVVETAPQNSGDSGSSDFIFYTGAGIAAAILLLSLAGFVRGRSEDSAKSRPL